MDPNNHEHPEKSNEEKAAEIVAEAIRDSFTLHGSGRGDSPTRT